MFWSVPLSIIRSFSLYTQQWYMSYRFADSLRAGSGWNTLISKYLFLEWNSTCFGQFLFPSSGVFHCTHSNGICHTGLQTALRAGSGWHCSSILLLEWNSTCFGQFLFPSSGVVHCTHSNGICHTGLQIALRAGSEWNCSSILILLANCLQTCMAYTIAVCTVENSWWWTEELSETCRASFQNKYFEKLVHLVGFTRIIRNFITMHGHMNVKFKDETCQ